MKTGFSFISILLTFFVIQNANSQQITYSGSIDYKFIRTNIAVGGGIDEGYNWSVNVAEKYLIEGTFYVTFTGGISPSGVAMYQMTSIEEDIHFENTSNKVASDERISQSCYNDKMKYTHTVTPGDSRVYMLAIRTKELDIEKPRIFSGYMTIISTPSNNKKETVNGTYSIMLTGEIKTDVTFISFDERKFPCISNYSEPSDSIIQTTKMNFPIAIIVEKAFDGSNILEGKKIITDTHDIKKSAGTVPSAMIHGNLSRSYYENHTVSWKLVKKSKD